MEKQDEHEYVIEIHDIIADHYCEIIQTREKKAANKKVAKAEKDRDKYTAKQLKKIVQRIATNAYKNSAAAKQTVK